MLPIILTRVAGNGGAIAPPIFLEIRKKTAFRVPPILLDYRNNVI